MLPGDARARFERDGFLVLPGFLGPGAREALMDRAAALVTGGPEGRPTFSTGGDQRRGGAFLSSASGVEVFYTEPSTVIGFWLALERADRQNGCLQVLPGWHRRPLWRRFVRLPGGGCGFVTRGPEPDWAEGAAVEVEAGALVAPHGQLPHRSDANTSDRSRQALALHVIDAAADYGPENWLQRDPALPLRGF